MTNSPFEIIEWLSATTTLQPGDIITTGTPAGVAMGMANPRWLTPGDTVRIEMTGLGTMETPVHEEHPFPEPCPSPSRLRDTDPHGCRYAVRGAPRPPGC